MASITRVVVRPSRRRRRSWYPPAAEQSRGGGCRRRRIAPTPPQTSMHRHSHSHWHSHSPPRTARACECRPPGGHEDRIAIAKNDDDDGGGGGGGGGGAPPSEPSPSRVRNLQEDDDAVDGDGGGVSGNMLLLNMEYRGVQPKQGDRSPSTKNPSYVECTIYIRNISLIYVKVRYVC